jgi:hypothetical protein
LKKAVPDSTLQFLGEAIVSDLLGVPSNYAGTALKSADINIAAFGLDNEAVARCILVPHPPAKYNPDRKEDANDNNNQYEDGQEHEAVDDVMSSYVDLSSPVWDMASTLPKELRETMWTRLAYSSGSVPWAYWKWALDRFQPTHELASACLNDLILRYIPEDASGDSRWQFADKESNTAVKELLGRGVVPFKQTAVEITRRILADMKVQHVTLAALEVGGVPARFVMVFAYIEKLMLGLAGARVIVVEDPTEVPVVERPRRDSIDTKLAGVMERFSNPGSMTQLDNIPRKPEDVLFMQDVEGVDGFHQRQGSNDSGEIKEENRKHKHEAVVRQLEDTQAVWADVPLVVAMEEADAPEDELLEGEVVETFGDDQQIVPGSYSAEEMKAIMFTPETFDLSQLTNGELREWAELIQRYVVNNAKWISVITTPSISESGPWGKPVIKFYAACYYLLKNVVDLSGPAASIFTQWDAEFLEKLQPSAPAATTASSTIVGNMASVFGTKTVSSTASSSTSNSPAPTAPPSPPRNATSSLTSSSSSSMTGAPLSDAERQKQTWDKAWNRLSSRLSTSKTN